MSSMLEIKIQAATIFFSLFRIPANLGPGSTSSMPLIKPDVSVNEGAVKLATWHHHLEINKACDDPSLGTGCGEDENA